MTAATPRPPAASPSATTRPQADAGDISADAAIIVWTSAPDDSVAARIARELVEARLAACVHCFPAGQSTYRWTGAVETTAEAVLMIKSTASRGEALECRLRELHPYEVPEMLVTHVASANPDYLEWLIECTR